MQILNEILTQYSQLSNSNKQYKLNLNNINYNNFINNNIINTINLNNNNKNTIDLRPETIDNKNYNINSFNIKDFYSQLEFDSRRYNRNFDSQIGVEIL